jgi:hypothetical protein
MLTSGHGHRHNEHLVVGFLIILFLFGMYVYESLALGFQYTHIHIIHRPPYALIRYSG